MNDAARNRVAAATIRLSQLGGQGVVVPGGLILTAAHCIDWADDGSMGLGDNYKITVETPGPTIYAQPLSVDLVNDIAVLGALDEQEFRDESVAFESFCKSIEPVPLAKQRLEPFERYPVHIRTHKGSFARGEVLIAREDSHSLAVFCEEQIEGGTSGGPIVDDDGCIVGIVSQAGDSDLDESCDGPAPRPSLCLPVWVINRILAATNN